MTKLAVLIERLDRLIVLMEKNERDRELSPRWRDDRGHPLERIVLEALRKPFEGPSE